MTTICRSDHATSRRQPLHGSIRHSPPSCPTIYSENPVTNITWDPTQAADPVGEAGANGLVVMAVEEHAELRVGGDPSDAEGSAEVVGLQLPLEAALELEQGRVLKKAQGEGAEVAVAQGIAARRLVPKSCPAGEPCAPVFMVSGVTERPCRLRTPREARFRHRATGYAGHHERTRRSRPVYRSAARASRTRRV